jgi:4-hydroxy-tetrahydrodipicolinate synthase
MKERNAFRGAGVAIVTPYTGDDHIDFSALSKQIEHGVNGGIDYIVLFGTTGEAPTITHEEKQKAVGEVARMISGRVPLVVGFGGNNTAELIKDISSFDFSGVDAILSVCPYYNKPNQEGIFQHFRLVCLHSPLPVIIYNVPGRTVVNMEPSTTIRIAQECPSVIGIKEATDNMDQVMDLILRKPDHLLVIAGDDALALPFMSLGADGLISVIANAFPYELSAIIHETLKGNFDAARKFHYQLLPLMQIMLKSGNPSSIKAVLNILGLCENNFRLPVYPVNEQQYMALKDAAMELLKK